MQILSTASRLLCAAALAVLALDASADAFINSGGPASGTYEADRYYTGGSAYAFTSQTGVYRDERWSTSSFSYAIPVTPGPVQVTLKLRENCTTCGTRSFNVQAEGQTVLSNVSVTPNTAGDRTFTVTSDATLNLTFTRVSGEAYVNGIEVRQVTTPAPTVTLTASPASIAAGATSTLTWSTTNATSCVASNAWTGARATSGTLTGPVGATATFTLTCSGPGGSASQSATITVVPPPAITITANPASVASGSASTVTWSVTNASSCTASDAWSGTRATSGSINTGALAATSTYTLTCTGTGGTSSQAATVTVGTAAPVVTLVASPATVASGGSSTLTWSTTNATACTASGAWGGSQPTSGTAATGPISSISTYSMTCTGPGGSASHSATVTVTGTATGPYPLRVEAGKRHLVDASGNPFFLNGDSAWWLIGGLTRENAEIYLENRRLKGMNTVLVALTVPRNAYGVDAFLTPNDFSTPNEAYFAHAEYVINLAAQKGMLLLLAPAYMGYQGGSEGWYQQMSANGEAKLGNYGQYVANRFRNYDNIIWVHGGDYDPPNRDLARAVANGIRAVDGRWLHTFHGGRGTAAMEFWGTGEPWLTLNDIYTFGYDVVDSAFQEYNRSQVPAFLIEALYEGAEGTQHTVRQQAYQAALSGMAGHVMGNAQVWPFPAGWQSAIDSPGAVGMSHLRALIESRQWWTLLPDVSGTLLTGGTGSGAGRAAAALASDRSFALLYVPDIRGLTVNMAQLAGPTVNARWYDPTSGNYSTIPGSPFAASGSRTFSPSANNGGGYGDWALVLESTSTGAAPTVAITAAPASIASGDASTLTWSSTNATGCTASGAWSGARATSGSASTGNLAGTATFTLTCTGAGGSASGSATVTVVPAPEVTLTATPASVESGSASTLAWSSTDAASCTASGAWSGTRATSGSASTGALSATSTYTLTCTGTGGSGSQSATVTVTAATPAPTVTISASPSSIASGASSTLTWSSTNATSCTASGAWSGARATSGSASTGSLAGTSTFTLTCTGAGGSGNQSTTVTVVPAPTVTLSAAPASVETGSASTLTWSSTNAASCTATGAWTGTRATSGSTSTGALSATSTYTLTCTGTGGTGSQSATVTVTAPPPAPTVAISASPASVASGGASTLTWLSTNSSSCTASGAWSGSRATSGSASTGNLAATSTFTLTCTGPGGNASQSATVTVVPAPTVTLTATPSSLSSGGASTLSWSSTNATSCTASGAWSGARATSGSASTGNLSSTSTYTLACTGTGGTASQTATVTVVTTQPDISINSGGPATGSYVADRNFTGGAAYTFTSQTGVYRDERWSSSSFSYAIPVTPGPVEVTLKLRESCTSCGTRRFNVQAEGQTVLSNVSVPVNTVGDRTFTVTSDATLNLVFTRVNGEAYVNGIEVRQLSSPPPTPAPTIAISATPASITSGSASTLAWSTTNATSCTASGAWSGARATSGSTSTGALSATSTYTLTCTGPGGSASQAATVTVTAPAPSPTVTIGASPASVTSGASSTLTWSSTNATSCTASGAWSGTRATSGSTSTGALSATSTFTLSCTGPGGTASQATTVTVTPANPAPTVTITASPASIASGASSTLTWSSANATSCTASGAWSGSQATSGSTSTGALSTTSTYTLTCSGPGGSTASNATVVVATSGSPFPLRTEAGKRYLVDAAGNPFLMHGEAAWSLMVQLSREDVDVYLENRRLKGVNTVLVNLTEHWFSDHPPTNFYNQGPFLTPGNYATPNEAYFAHAEYVIAKAAEKGILVLLCPSYMGYGGGQEGWYQEMGSNGVTKLTAYGQYVANRLRAFDNILWVHGGDYDPPDRSGMRAIANGILSVDTKWLHTFHGARGTGAVEFLGTSEAWLQVNTSYTDVYTVMDGVIAEYNRSTLPMFFIEGNYEVIDLNARDIRLQAWQAMLSGAVGQLIGNSVLWQFSPGWQSAMESAGARSMPHLRSLLAERSWWTLQPDTTNTTLTAGMGTGQTRAPAARAADGSFALAYVPDIRTVTINMARLAGPRVSARWYDPSAGTYRAITGSPFTASGSRTFNAGSNNAGGSGDWVLVLESVP